MMRFSSDSKTLVILSGSTFDNRYTVYVVRLDGDKAFGEVNFVISQTSGDTVVHEAKQIDVCYERKEFYITCGAWWAFRLYTFDFEGNFKDTKLEARAVSVSPDQKLLAYSHSSNHIHLKRLATGENLGAIKTTALATAIEWFPDGTKIVVAIPRAIIAYDVYTFDEIFRIENEEDSEGVRAEIVSHWSKLQMISGLYLVFEDKSGKLKVYDVKYDKIQAVTDPIAHEGTRLKFGGDDFHSTSAWGIANYNMFI
jgi:WD40 repeat protein